MNGDKPQYEMSSISKPMEGKNTGEGTWKNSGASPSPWVSSPASSAPGCHVDQSDYMRRYTEIRSDSKQPALHMVKFSRRRTVTRKCTAFVIILLLALIGLAIGIYFVVTEMRDSPAVKIYFSPSPPLTPSSSSSSSSSAVNPSTLSSSPSSSSQVTSSRTLLPHTVSVSNPKPAQSGPSLTTTTRRITTSGFHVQSAVTTTKRTTTTFEPSVVRLAGELVDEGEGRIEVYHQGEWGTVCKTLFNDVAAAVLCRMLGYTGITAEYKLSRFGPGTGPIWLSSVVCKGDETTIDACKHDDWGVNNCQHKDDVSISCDKK